MHIMQEFPAPLVEPRTAWRRISLAPTNATAAEMEALYVEQSWRGREVWDGFMHPDVGALGRWGGGYVWGKFKYWYDKIPQWLLGVIATLAVKRYL
jgi:hypothetical protein